MLQFATLLNELTESGVAQFTSFLNTARTSDASQAGRWLGSATDQQVKSAAALLNEGRLDDFRAFIGIRRGFWSRLLGR